MNLHHFNRILSERIETFRHLSETALYPEVKEWADDCADVMQQVIQDWQKCYYEEPEECEDASNTSNRRFSVVYDPKSKKHPSRMDATVLVQSKSESILKHYDSRTAALTDALWMMANLQNHLEELEVFYKGISLFHWVKNN